MKKGFTLIELLGVIVILGILALIVTVAVNSIITDSKTTLTKSQKATIEKAAEEYYLKEGMDSNAKCVNVSVLKSKGYLNSDVVDLTTKKNLQGSVSITLSSNSYKFTYRDYSC